MRRRKLAVLAAAFLVGAGQAHASQASSVAQELAQNAPQGQRTAGARDVQPAAASGKAEPVLVEADAVFEPARLDAGQLMSVYRLSKYDVINVQVMGFPEGLGYGSTDSVKVGAENTQSLSANDFLIGPDGRAAVPYAGNVQLVGLTVDEASQLLKERLSTYLNDPQVSVSIRSYGPRKVYVMGEVKTPGIQELQVDSMNAYAALTSAGGWTNRGRSTRVQVVRIKDGVMYYKQINMKTYMTRHDLRQNVALQDGDVVYVPRSNGIIWNEDILPYLNGWALYKSLTND